MPFAARLPAHDVERPGWCLPLHVDMNRAVPIDPQTELVPFFWRQPQTP